MKHVWSRSIRLVICVCSLVVKILDSEESCIVVTFAYNSELSALLLVCGVLFELIMAHLSYLNFIIRETTIFFKHVKKLYYGIIAGGALLCLDQTFAAA